VGVADLVPERHGLRVGAEDGAAGLEVHVHSVVVGFDVALVLGALYELVGVKGVDEGL
jgi:hypothetical protein